MSGPGRVRRKSTPSLRAVFLPCEMIKNCDSLIILVLAARIAAAQDPTPGADLPTDARSPVNSTGAGGFVGMPVVRSTPQLGFGLGAVGAFLFRIDSASPQSVVGAGGVYSDTQSWLFGVGSRVLFHGGSRDGAAGIALFELNYDFFGVGVKDGNADHSVPISQNGDAEMIQMLGRVYGRFFAGPRYLHRGVTTTLKEGAATDAISDIARQQPDYNVSALGIETAYDSRDQEDTPHRGTLAEATAMFGRDWLGTDQPFNYYRGWINQYVPLSSGGAMLAFRALGCSVDANAPVWELCLYGVQSDLRGYAGGRYRDRTMFATQAEIRVPVADRLGAALFGGVGGVARAFSAYAVDQLLPAGGLGLRYLVSESYHLNVGADVAWGKNGAAFYLRLGEAY